mmetsp:Transcript_23556/g.39719  ORF Transcript_23556/g.39719 Transcript_23556/m.39719 type:complete len:95 (+) Transcript_23556:169-453(+)
MEQGAGKGKEVFGATAQTHMPLRSTRRFARPAECGCGWGSSQTHPLLFPLWRLLVNGARYFSCGDPRSVEQGSANLAPEQRVPGHQLKAKKAFR